MEETRICKICYEEKDIFEFTFYKGKTCYTCKDCTKLKYKEDYRNWQLENCGGERIRCKPNQYHNDIQKECVFKLMKSFGYLFNESKGIWWKPGIRDEDGNFLLIKGRKKFVSEYTRIDKKTREQVIIYHKSGYNNARIENLLNISNASVHKIIKNYLDEKGE